MNGHMHFLALVCALAGRALAAETQIHADADFPGGNIRVQRVEGDTLFVAPDQRDTQPGQWWFYWNFRLRAPAGQPVEVVFTEKNPIGVRGPAVSVDGGTTWRWLGASAVQTLQQQGQAAWSFTAQVPEGAAEMRLAFCPQYLESHLRTWLTAHTNHLALRVEELCRSRQGRPVELLRVGTGRDVVLLTSRHHCCEAMATYAVEGFLEATLAGDLSRRWQVIAVPFMDKDGVESGDQGKFRAPHDHNRDYSDKPLYPEVAALMKLGEVLTNRVAAAFDLHCPHIRGEWNDRVYLVGSADPERWRQQRQFAVALEEVQQGRIRFRASDCLAYGRAWNKNSNYQQGRSVGAWAQVAFPSAKLVASMEIPYADARGDEVNADSARALGRDLAHALARHLDAPRH